jgi:hypothetical protein
MEDLHGRQPERRGCSATDFALVRLAWCLGVALALASLAPAPLFTAAFSALLGLAALALAVAASLRREPLLPAQLGRWDVAAVLYLLGELFGRAVDREVVRGFLAEAGLAG